MTTQPKTYTCRAQRAQRMMIEITRFLANSSRWTHENTVDDLKYTSDEDVIEIYGRLVKMYGLPAV